MHRYFQKKSKTFVEYLKPRTTSHQVEKLALVCSVWFFVEYTRMVVLILTRIMQNSHQYNTDVLK